MIRIFVTGILVILWLNASAQIVVSGYVSDRATGERLIEANIFEKDTKRGAVTNAYGFYSISFVKRDSVTLLYSYIGYQTDTVYIEGVADTAINVMLNPGEEKIGEVRVTASLKNEDRAELGTITVPVSEMRKIPALGGEPDLIKVLQLMPGVQAGDEGKSGLYVRGGSPDQNLILLDDVPLYYVNHLGGFVSTFNVDALSNVTMIKGGFPARYGSRLSSIIDVRMKDGNMKEFHGAGALGLISAKMMVEGPIKPDTISYLVSARRFMYDLIMRPVTKIAFHGFTTAYTFYDFNGKLNIKPDRNNRLFFSFYAGDDNFFGKIRNNEYHQKSRITYHWGNLLGAFRWNHLFGPFLFSNTTLTYTRYRYKTLNLFTLDTLSGEFRFLSAVRDIHLKTDFEYYPFNALKIRAGMGGIAHKYIPTSSRLKQNSGNAVGVDSVYDEYSELAYEWNGYLENEFRIGSVFTANLGVRYSGYSLRDTLFSSFEPRLLFNVKFERHTSLKLSYSFMQQYIHLLTSSGAGMSVDYWVPTTKYLPPETSRQYGIGLTHSQKIFDVSLEGYFKTMDHLITFGEGIGLLSGTGNWQKKVDGNGRGTSYGMEFFLRKNSGKLNGWLSYTWSKTTRQFKTQNFGKRYPYKYDRRHVFNITGIYHLNKRIDFSATWIFGTGNPVTLAIAHQYVIDENEGFPNYDPEKPFMLDDGYIYGGKNAFRMRSYHRLDVGVNFTKKKKWGERTWSVSVYNLYNRQNPYFYFLSTSKAYQEHKSNDASLHVYQQTLFPIMPSVSYRFKF